MRKTPYILKNLSIIKMPGFSRGLESLTDLAAHVNIILGANGSGKSSTSRVIQQLIWHDKTKGLEVEGSVSLEQDAWEIKIDSGKTVVQRNGNEDQMSGLPSVESQHRYLLALHKLVEEKENDLAKEIAKQSIGGFDLDAAQNSLKYSSKISNKSISEYKNFKETEEKFRDARDRQKELKNEGESVIDLKEKKEKAQNAARLHEFYTKVADYLEAKSRYTLLSSQMSAFSDSMKNLTGREGTEIEELEDQIEEYQLKIEKAKEEIKKSEKELAVLTIPAEGVSDQTLTEIEKRVEHLTDLNRDISGLEKEIAGLKTEELTTLQAFGDSIDPTAWKSLTIDDVSGLDKMLKDAHQVLGEKQFLVSEIESLEEEATNYNKDVPDPDKLKLGIKTLGEWLKESTNRSGIPLWVVIAISLLGIISPVVTFLVGWPGLIGFIFIIPIFIYAYFNNNKESNTLDLRKKDFIHSGLQAPSEWNTTSVTDRVDALIDNLRDGKDAERISGRLKICNSNLSKLKDRIDSLEQIRKEWIDRLQTAPGFPENNIQDFSSLYWFLIQVKKWQTAHIQRESLESQWREITEQFKIELNKINALFTNSNVAVVDDPIKGKISFKELETQETRRRDHIKLINQQKEQIEEQVRLMGRAVEKQSTIYQDLNINQNDKEALQILINQLSVYKQTLNEHYAAQQAFFNQETFIKEHSLYDENEIKDLSIDEAKVKISQNEEIANQLEKIQEQITSIETKIQVKKSGHELEDLLTKKESALEDLDQLYEKNLSSAAGDLIINQLKIETQNKNRPEVFKLANKIFSNITNGRYELSLDDKGEPNFRAYDTQLKLGQELSELSTGTRVQLLLSVRLAYVETVESSIKLPLLVDELLANSDDERAKAIIESLIEISREGRQIFYFTAQADEVNKWAAYLKEETDLEYKIIQLDGRSNKLYNTSELSSDLAHFSLLQLVPQPNGKSHEEYGKIISTLPFNLLTHNSSELPPWYFMEDVDLLYACLERGIKSWGQLESFYKYGGQIQNFDEELFKQIEHKIELLKRFQELYQKGRSRQIDRTILESSGTISIAYMDRVAEKLDRLDRDPKLLIQALKDGEIGGFRKNKTEDLENYLIAEGYIDEQEVLETDDIILHMHALISSFKMNTAEVEHFMARILKNDTIT